MLANSRPGYAPVVTDGRKVQQNSHASLPATKFWSLAFMKAWKIVSSEPGQSLTISPGYLVIKEDFLQNIFQAHKQAVKFWSGRGKYPAEWFFSPQNLEEL